MLVCKKHPNTIQGWNVKYCYECGSELEQMPSCKKCGYMLDVVIHKFCPMCGEKVDNG